MTSAKKNQAANAEIPLHKIAAFQRYFLIKRLLDVCFSLVGLLFAAVPMLLIAAAVRADSSGSAVFKQKRIGRNGKPFTCYKFRTMKKSAPGSIATGALEDADAYITKIGRFLRKTSLDELPQLWNILKGDMSLIGPRPLIPEETQVHEGRLRAGVYALRPGLTGYAQINGRDLVSAEEKVRMDTEYLQNYSLKTDIGILCRTFFNVLSEKDIHEGMI